MTNVVSALLNEEKDAWLNLNDIRQNAKKHNWKENPGKQNNYIFSKDNVKICIIGLKGLVTIDFRLLSGVNYKLCKSNLKEEEIYDLFSTNSFFNYTNDVLQKTVLCNSYDLTVKEKIDLFNKNDKSFLQGVKCKDLFSRTRGGSHSLGSEKAKMGTTKVRSSATNGEGQVDHNSIDFPEEKKVQVNPIESTHIKLQPEEGKQLQKENAHIRNSLYENAFDVTPLSKAVNKAVLSNEADKDNKRVLKIFGLFNKRPRDKVTENSKGFPSEGGANSPTGKDSPCGNDHSGEHPKVQGKEAGEIYPKGSDNRKGEKNCIDYGVKKGRVKEEKSSPHHILCDHTRKIEEEGKLNVGNSKVSTELDANNHGANKTKEKKQNLNDNRVSYEQELTLSLGIENNVVTPNNDTFGKFNSGEKSSLCYGSTKGNSREYLEWCDTLSRKRECYMLKSFTMHSLSEEDLDNEELHRMSASDEETANWWSGEGHTNGPGNGTTSGRPLHAAKTHETDLAPSKKEGDWCITELSPSHSDCHPADDVVDGEECTNGHLLENVTNEGENPIDCNAGYQPSNHCTHKTNTVNIYIQNNTVQYYGPKYRHSRKAKARLARDEHGLSHLKGYRSCGEKWSNKWGRKWDRNGGSKCGNKWDNHWGNWENWDSCLDHRWNNCNAKYNHYNQPVKKNLVNGHSFSPRNSHHLAVRIAGKNNCMDKNSAYYSHSWTKRFPKYYTEDPRKVYNNGSGQMVGFHEEATYINAEEHEKNGKPDYPFWGVQKSKGAHHFYDKSSFYITKNRNNYARRKYNECKPSDALQPYEPHKKVKELEKEIYNKLTYLKHFKHDDTKSIPRYYCTFRHLLAPSRTRKRPLWLQNMIDTNKCGYCDEQFSSLKNLEKHFVHVKTHRIYYCCGKPFSSLKFLYIHLRRDNHYGYVYYY
ncbi:hypothetical protein C922_03180 [Plasmodium inui San Antonio 1]|uniref:C2H2-type domain-containing protein n=1 Tax=Plasmodium inui San Antonio 1 TaxID=1237626 RepID=W7AMN1_9APIC|nr:hypothetical protein C922_03180 [Plasmodium inui San Antonio 1]EUD66546.1 hypothetical protein C922_03180 [Plasmodium inui San Antonio 1]